MTEVPPVLDRPTEVPAGRPGRLVEQVHARLRRAVLDGELEVGERLRDSVLAEQLGVSRAPVREALRMLEQSGLLLKPPNRSYVIARFTESDIRELARMRVGHETLAVRVVVRERLSLGPAAAALEDLRVAADSRVEATVIAADRAFHEALVACARQARLDASYGALRDQVELAMRQTDAYGRGREGLVRRHADLLGTLRGAVAAGDPQVAMEQLERHILEGMACPDAL
ncbi:GntR family transcriptional regulator [Pseudonocardia sp. C8]|uniref:GntR family transcriptional regulator n=1 Tax=Pseudonocardia sp. C8 TaxID=2762759 RepID=UPI0016431C71|nr:GntR family transcriptional regulator [Pseudonocardia sp. C8]MBC3191168.1 GntR family transcriptional regulator [Pseudonocardia sp. C8]